MTTIYSSNPYFDDYDETKNFEKILFRPGRAVQARELNQVQTMSQKQIERFGNFVFKEGSIVSECSINILDMLVSIKLNDVDTLGDIVNVSTIVSGCTMLGLTSGLQGTVKAALDGLQATPNNTKTIVFNYSSFNDTNVSSLRSFIAGETIRINRPDGTLLTNVVSLDGTNYFSMGVEIGSGVLFVGNIFVSHQEQFIVVSRYDRTFSGSVGLELIESIVNSDEDESLLDPALGFSNYFAPGADRLKISTKLSTRTPQQVDQESGLGQTENFFTLLSFVNGAATKSFQQPQLDLLLDEMAQRTYEESGHYTVTPFRGRIREHFNSGLNGGVFDANSTPVGNISKLAIGIEPGVAYINGYRFQNLVTEYISIDKGIDTIFEDQQPVSFGYGNYVVVNESVGPWDVDNGVLVSLRSSNAQAITNETYGITAAPGSEVGTARVKSVVYESGITGLANAQYRLYLYDVNLTANVPFGNVRSVFFNATTGTDSLADIVLTSNVAILEESSFNTGVFRFPQTALKRLRNSLGNIDNAFIFKKNFDVTIAVDGTFIVNSPIGNEEFPFSLGALNNTQKRDSIVLVLKNAVNTTNLSGNVSFAASSNSITGLGTTFNTQLKNGDRISVEGNVFKIVQVIDNTSLVISGNTLTQVASNVAYQKQFGSGEIIDLTINGSSGAARAVSLVTDTQISLDIEESLATTVDAKIMLDVQKTNGQEIAKVLNQNKFVKIDCSSAGTVGPFNLGFSDVFRIVSIFHGTTFSESNTDVTNQFVLDNGQRETIYSHARLSLRAGSTLSLSASSRLLIKLDFFAHSFSSGVGFLSVDSYPIDDTGLSPGTIRTEQIPIFFGTGGLTFDLRNSIDIRPRATDTAVNAASIGAASINPAAPTSINVPSGGLRVPVPNEQFITDLEFFIGRIDRIYIDPTYRFGSIRGVPSLFPAIPEEQAKTMTVCIVSIPPFPSLPPQSAQAVQRFDYQTNLKLIDNKRYTMKDIGVLNQKISRLEYYTSLNLLEVQAKELVIPSDATGLDRFKNGFLVDGFTGHNIGNVLDPAYEIAIDPVAKELRPSFLIDNIDLQLNKSLSSGIMLAPRDATLTVTNVTGNIDKFSIVTQGGVTGLVKHFCDNKIYLLNVSGTFSASASFSSNSGGTGTVTSVFTPPDGDLVTLPYQHEVCTINPFATKPRNCAEHLVFSYIGEIELFPPYDNWIDTNVKPELVVNFDNNYDNWLALDKALGTQWRNWLQISQGTPQNKIFVSEKIASTSFAGDGSSIQLVNQTFKGTRTDIERRIGFDISVSPEHVVYDLGNRVVDTSIIPFIRPQSILFNANRLMPNIRVFAFFDGEKVSPFCRPFGGKLGDPLITDSVGQLVGEFVVPSNNTLKFRTGQRLFVLASDPENREGFNITFAYGEFTASGIQQTLERTILSSRGAKVVVEQTIETRPNVGSVSWVENVSRYIPPPPPVLAGGADPVAQTFEIDGDSFENGIFITKVDLYFRTKHPTLPITFQIRETIAGYPGRRSIPFGTVTLFPEDIHVSEDATLASAFSFKSPVYLSPRVEYAAVVLPAGNNPEYNIWVSELGQNQLNTTNRVSTQPLLGVFFTSANDNAWSAVQNEDMKITIYRALFDINTTGSIVLENTNEDYVTVSTFNGLFNPGDNVIFSSGVAKLIEFDTIGNEFTLLKFGSGNIKSKVNGTGTITALSGNATIIGNNTLFTTEVFSNAVVYSSNTNTRLGKVLNVISDTQLTLTLGSIESITGNVFAFHDELTVQGNANVNARVETINSKLITLFDTSLNYLDFIQTKSTFEFRVRDDSSNTLSTFTSFTLNEDEELESMARIDSASIEASLFSSAKSFNIRNTMTTTNKYISPLLDTGKLSAIIVKNIINNDSTNETTNRGNAVARYISKQVILDVDQDAEDLKCFLTAYKPSGTDIKVFAKLLNAGDGTAFAERGYLELERVTSSIVISDAKFENDYKEFEYRLPDSVLTGINGAVQYTESGNTFTGYKSFAIKIVLLSNDPAIYPKVKNYRAISIQI